MLNITIKKQNKKGTPNATCNVCAGVGVCEWVWERKAMNDRTNKPSNKWINEQQQKKHGCSKYEQGYSYAARILCKT